MAQQIVHNTGVNYTLYYNALNYFKTIMKCLHRILTQGNRINVISLKEISRGVNTKLNKCCLLISVSVIWKKNKLEFCLCQQIIF